MPRRSEQAIKIAGGNQKQCRGNQVEEGIFDSPVELLALGPQNQQPEGGNQQNLEPDVEIEDIAGEKRTEDPRHDQHQERVEAVTAAGVIHVAAAIYAGTERHQRRGGGEERAEQINREGNPEGRQPASHGHGQRAVLDDMGQQPERHQHQYPQRWNGDHRLQIRALAQHQQYSADEDAPDDRSDDQPIGGRHRIHGVNGGEILKRLAVNSHCRSLLSNRLGGLVRPPVQPNASRRNCRSQVPERRGNPTPEETRRTRTR